MPKAELHIHIEGSLEPELIFALAQRNGVALAYPSVEALRAAYAFTDLQSFLDIYYAGASVLLHEQDFFDMAWAYFERAAADNVVHAEIFFDPQTHTDRGVPIATVIQGLARACQRAQPNWASAPALILCFLRHLSEDAALATLEQALPYATTSSAWAWTAANAATRRRSSRASSHAAANWACIWWPTPAKKARRPTSSALDVLQVSASTTACAAPKTPRWCSAGRARMPLTVCPLSNVKLCVFKTMAEHNLPALLRGRPVRHRQQRRPGLLRRLHEPELRRHLCRTATGDANCRRWTSVLRRPAAAEQRAAGGSDQPRAINRSRRLPGSASGQRSGQPRALSAKGIGVHAQVAKGQALVDAPGWHTPGCTGGHVKRQQVFVGGVHQCTRAALADGSPAALASPHGHRGRQKPVAEGRAFGRGQAVDVAAQPAGKHALQVVRDAAAGHDQHAFPRQ
jgi:hypothetical protein